MSAALDVAPEEATIILPDVSMEVVTAFISTIYEGSFVLSSPKLASEVGDLMASFGLHIPANRWRVDAIPPSLQQVGQAEPEPGRVSDQGEGGAGGGVERPEVETPGITAQPRAEAEPRVPGSTEEMLQVETVAGDDGLELLQQASLMITEREEDSAPGHKEDSRGKLQVSSKDQVRADLEISDDRSVEEQEDQPRPDQGRTEKAPSKFSSDDDEVEVEEKSKEPSSPKGLSTGDDDEGKNGEEVYNNVEDDKKKPDRDQMILPIINDEVSLDEDVQSQVFRQSPSHIEEPLDLSMKPSMNGEEEISVEPVLTGRKRKKARSADVDDEGPKVKSKEVPDNVKAPKRGFDKLYMKVKTKKVKKNLQVIDKTAEHSKVPKGQTSSRNLDELRRQVEKSIKENKNKKYLGFGETKPEEQPKERKKVRSLKKAAKTVTEEEKKLMRELEEFALSHSTESHESDV